MASRLFVPSILALATTWLPGCEREPDDPDRPGKTDEVTTETGTDTDTDTDTTEPTESPPFTASDPIVCAAPSDRDLQPMLALDEGDWAARPTSGGAWGALAADLDADGWLDVILPAQGGTRLYLGGPDGLRDATDTLPPVAQLRHRAASAADVDDDGDLDVYLGGREIDDYLLINDGTAHFEPRWVQFGSRTMGAAFSDLDGDEDLDLVISNGTSGTEPVVFLNDGAGMFEPRSDLLPDDFGRGAAFVVSPIDLDEDLLPDLYRANDAGPGGPENRVGWNRGGTFEYDDGSSGLHLDICSMGLGVGDINGDQIPDLALSDCRDLHLMESTAVGVWVDFADATGLQIDPPSGHDVPWGVEMVDLDNDADLDLYVAYGFLANTTWYNEPIQRDGVYLQGDDGQFVEVSESWGIAEGQSRGFAVADLNNDGWLDIVKQDWMGRPQIYSARCGDASWLRITLDQGERRNRVAVGARVTVTSGDRQQTRWVRAGGTSVGSGGPPEVHFGLADAETVDVEVLWPDGGTNLWSDLPTRRLLTLHRP